MKITSTDLEGVLIIEPDVYSDHRGFFFETYNQKKYQKEGIVQNFVQDNLSFSKKNTLRGLHFQITQPQAKLVQAIQGEIFDVAVDIRMDSKNFGKWTGIILSENNKKQFLIPEGFAHGFCVLSETALFSYKCSNFYKPNDEGGIIWNDPDIGIKWPISDPILSEKDKNFSILKNFTRKQLYLPDFHDSYCYKRQ